MVKAGISLAILGVCAVGLSRPVAAQNLVQNGGFEAPNIGTGVAPDQGYVTYPTDSLAIAGWKVTSGTVDQVTSDPNTTYHWNTPDGSLQSIDLSGSSAGSLTQSVTTDIGKKYILSFYLAGNPYGGSQIMNLNVSFAGTNVTNSPITFNTAGKTPTDMGWVQQYFVVTGTGGPADLTFSSLTDGYNGPAIDNVSLTAVTPEAGGLFNLAGALLAPGLGMLAIRRRPRKKASLLAA